MWEVFNLAYYTQFAKCLLTFVNVAFYLSFLSVLPTCLLLNPALQWPSDHVLIILMHLVIIKSSYFCCDLLIGAAGNKLSSISQFVLHFTGISKCYHLPNNSAGNVVMTLAYFKVTLLNLGCQWCLRSIQSVISFFIFTCCVCDLRFWQVLYNKLQTDLML